MNDGNKLKILRSEYGYSQREIAEKIGMSKSKYCRLENNETILIYDELIKILKIYSISFEDFSGINLPIKRVVTYPQDILDRLEKVIAESKMSSEDWNLNREQFNLLRQALNPVIKLREKALDLPDLDLSGLECDITVKTVTFDVRGEKLIDECLELQNSYCKRLFGGAD